METNPAPIRGVTPVDGNDIPTQLGSQCIMNSKRMVGKHEVTPADTKQALYVNEAYETITGRIVSELNGKPIFL
jgi:hypothetical protein